MCIEAGNNDKIMLRSTIPRSIKNEIIIYLSLKKNPNFLCRGFLNFIFLYFSNNTTLTFEVHPQEISK
jgi:hypothetical protein